MRLYGISEQQIRQTLEQPESEEQQGRYRLAYHAFGGLFDGKPLKVVYLPEAEPFIVTAYPLRKSYRLRTMA